MTIPDYSGEAFVAFADIAGFKEMMKHEHSAIEALDTFYKSGYEVLAANRNVSGLFVSDCAVLFTNARVGDNDKLRHMLTVLEQLNRKVLQGNLMLTTSVAYGPFSYHQRLDFSGISKQPVYGNAYIAAFLDNASRHPKIQPGQCRILKKGLPHLDHDLDNRLISEGNHEYFYWMTDNESAIPDFKKRYDNSYQQQYRGMLEAIKEAITNE